jgi:hypothetical protein
VDTTEAELGDDQQQNGFEEVILRKIDLAVPPPNMHPSLQLGVVALRAISQSGPSSIVDEPPKKKRARESGSTSKKPRRARLMDAEQRRAVLEADPLTDIVEPVSIQRVCLIKLFETFTSGPYPLQFV